MGCHVTNSSFNNIPIKIILLNNGSLGLVKQWQELFYKKRYSETCVKDCVDFVKLAEVYEVWG